MISFQVSPLADLAAYAAAEIPDALFQSRDLVRRDQLSEIIQKDKRVYELYVSYFHAKLGDDAMRQFGDLSSESVAVKEGQSKHEALTSRIVSFFESCQEFICNQYASNHALEIVESVPYTLSYFSRHLVRNIYLLNEVDSLKSILKGHVIGLDSLMSKRDILGNFRLSWKNGEIGNEDALKIFKAAVEKNHPELIKIFFTKAKIFSSEDMREAYKLAIDHDHIEVLKMLLCCCAVKGLLSSGDFSSRNLMIEWSVAINNKLDHVVRDLVLSDRWKEIVAHKDFVPENFQKTCDLVINGYGKASWGKGLSGLNQREVLDDYREAIKVLGISTSEADRHKA